MIKSRNAFTIVLRYLVASGLTREFAYGLLSAKTYEEQVEILRHNGMLSSDFKIICDFANFVSARSGFDLVKLERKSS